MCLDRTYEELKLPSAGYNGRKAHRSLDRTYEELKPHLGRD